MIVLEVDRIRLTHRHLNVHEFFQGKKMKYLLVSVLIAAPSFVWSKTEEQALAIWTTSCTDAGGTYLVDQVTSGDADQTEHFLHICEYQGGKLSVRIVPAMPSGDATGGTF